MVWANSSPQEQKVELSIQKAVDYLHEMQNTDGGFSSKKGRPSSPGLTSWVIMALGAAGDDVTGEKWAPSGQNPVDYLKNCGYFPESTTDYARIILSLTAAGEGTVYQNVDLSRKLTFFQMKSGQFGQADLNEQGLINSHMWAIIALASAERDIPERELVNEWLLSRQNQDGGFGWADGAGSDPDDTGVALQALILLKNNPKNYPPIKSALQYLKKHQGQDGGFSSEGNESNSATDAWVLQGLAAVGEDPESEDWSFNDNSVITHLLSLQDNDGYFIWKQGVKSNPVLMTAYAMMALAEKPFPVNIDYGQINP